MKLPYAAKNNKPLKFLGAPASRLTPAPSPKSPPQPYAFLLLPPFLALDPVTSAVSSGDDAPAAASIALSSSSVYWGPAEDPAAAAEAGALALLGSRVPMTGTVEASMVWKGVATKRPAASNHSVKERERLMVVGLPDLGAMVIVRL